MAYIENYINVDEIIWGQVFHKAWIDKAYEKDDEVKELIDFLYQKVSFWYYNDIFATNPFKPFADFTASGGGRSVDFNDLSKDNLINIERCVDYTNNHLILGFLNDILGLARNNNENKYVAAKHFIEYAKELLGNRKYSNLILRPIERAFALFSQLKNAKEIDVLVETFLDYDKFENSESEYIFKVSLIKMFFTHRQKTYLKILPHAENIFKQFNAIGEYNVHSIILAKIILKIYKSIGDKDNKYKWAVSYAESLCKCDLPIIEVEKEIDCAIDELDKMNNFVLVNKLRLKKKQLTDKFYDGFDMQTVNFTPPKRIAKSITDARKQLSEKFEKLNGVSQFCFFISEFNAYSKEEIKKQLERNGKQDVIDFVNKIRFDENKEIIFQSSIASEKQKIEYETYELYEIHGITTFNLLINTFLYYLKLDEDLILLINDIVNHNELVYKNREVIINNIIKGISKRQIRSALAGLLPQFEEGVRHYIEKKGVMPYIRSGGNEIKASLAQVMNNSAFRALIDELLGDDLTQHIDYLACKELGGNLRNKYAHEGYGNDEQFTIDEVVLFCLLIKAYCMGYE